MRLPVVALLISLALALPTPAHAKYPIRPATYADLLDGEKIAGFRYYFTTKGRYRVEGEFYELREVLSYEERYKALERGLITGWEVDNANTFWRYEGIRGGDLHTIEILAAGHDEEVWAIRAEPRWPEGVTGMEAQLAHLGLRLTKVRAVAPTEGGRLPGTVLVETDDPRVLVGLGAPGRRAVRAAGGSHWFPNTIEDPALAFVPPVTPGAPEVLWVVREVLGTAEKQLGQQPWEAFAASTRARVAAGDTKAIDAVIPLLAASAPLPEGAALGEEVIAGLARELAAAGAARAGAKDPARAEWVAALQREARALATIARVRAPREDERAAVVGAFAALVDTFERRAAAPGAGGTEPLHRGAASFARALGEAAAKGTAAELLPLADEAGRLAPLLALRLEGSEPVWTRADALVGALGTVTRGHAEDPRAAALAAPAFALLDTWAEELKARGMVGRAVSIGVAVDRAAGRLPTKELSLAAALSAPEATAWQREAASLLGRVVGAPAADASSATAFREFVKRFSLLRHADGAMLYPHDVTDLAASAKKVGGPALTFARWEPKVNVREGVVGYEVTETRTRTVETEVDNTAAYASMDARLLEIERQLAWIEAEKAKVWAQMPVAVSDDQVVLDRVTGMAIGPGTGSGKDLNEKRKDLQARLDYLEGGRQGAIDEYRRLSGTVLPETRVERHTEQVDVVKNVIVWQGEVRVVHELRGGGAASLYEQVREVPDVQVRFEPEKKGLVERELRAMHKDEAKVLVPLFRRWLDARLALYLDQERAAHGWSDAELAAEREALGRLLATK